MTSPHPDSESCVYVSRHQMRYLHTVETWLFTPPVTRTSDLGQWKGILKVWLRLVAVNVEPERSMRSPCRFACD